ncbi:MAG TPA: hypothetical protein VH164_16475, partial [Ktedonobacteraceae bacterium]|nr:hypothetical protein [Ktedonobacteraceae bacterium]
MALCLDTEECLHENQDINRFCASCGIPLAGSVLQGRYEIHTLRAGDRASVTLNATDRSTGKTVTVRALRPNRIRPEDRADFLQDAELALTFSSTMREPGTICVTDFGEDGPVAFLVKTLIEEQPAEVPPARSRVTIGGTEENFRASPTLLNVQQEKPVRTGKQFVQPAPAATLSPLPSTPAPTQPAPPGWLARGDRAYELADYEDALSAYEQALAEDALSVDAWNGRGA